MNIDYYQCGLGLLCGIIWGIFGIIGFIIEAKIEKYDGIDDAPEEFVICVLLGCISLIIICIGEFLYLLNRIVKSKRGK